jgi:outer membrane protein assembly factor BamB
MSTANAAKTPKAQPTQSAEIGSQAKAPLFWPAVALLCTFWAFRFGAEWIEMSMFFRFVSRMVAHMLLLVLFLAWWLTNRRVSRADRWRALGVFAGGAVLAGLLADKSIGMFVIMVGLPFVLKVWVGWLMFTGRLLLRTRRIGFCALVLLTWLAFDTLRLDGLDGGQHNELAWRWSPTAEQLFLASRTAQKPEASIMGTHGPEAKTGPAIEPSIKVLPVSTEDWPEFRGPARDDRVHAALLDTAWQTTPPKLVWRQRVGPGWSSMAIVGGLLFTQEQRGDKEAVVCYDAATGAEMWVHEDAERFSDNLSGAGPRGTPTYSDSRIYALGARGRLNCLQATSGHVIWSRDIVADSGAPIPMWGFSNSPLVVAGTVIVWAGKEGSKGLLAYRVETGEPAWAAAAGKNSYSSPQLATLGGVEQLLVLSDHGVTATDPRTGKILWEHVLANDGMYMPVAQPQVIDDKQLLIPHPGGISLIEVTHQADQWQAKKRWESKSLKLTLNDFVISDGSIYGFDDGILSCLDLETGKRRWKQGRYGHGQVLLLAEQKLLLVLSETGDAVLLAANPTKLEELGRFKAIDGKTWNHPVIAHGQLYARNGEEMACYDLGRPVAR